MTEKDVKEIKEALLDIKKLLLVQCLSSGQGQSTMAKVLGTSQASISRLAPSISKTKQE